MPKLFCTFQKLFFCSVNAKNALEPSVSASVRNSRAPAGTSPNSVTKHCFASMAGASDINAATTFQTRLSAAVFLALKLACGGVHDVWLRNTHMHPQIHEPRLPPELWYSLPLPSKIVPSSSHTPWTMFKKDVSLAYFHRKRKHASHTRGQERHTRQFQNQLLVGLPSPWLSKVHKNRQSPNRSDWQVQRVGACRPARPGSSASPPSLLCLEQLRARETNGWGWYGQTVQNRAKHYSREAG